MNPLQTAIHLETRRQFLAQGARGFGALALASLFGDTARAGGQHPAAVGGQPGLPHFAPKATRAVYLHMVGAPPQMDLYDYKPKMREWFDRDLPDSVRMGQRPTTTTNGQTPSAIAPAAVPFPP